MQRHQAPRHAGYRVGQFELDFAAWYPHTTNPSRLELGVERFKVLALKSVQQMPPQMRRQVCNLSRRDKSVTHDPGTCIMPAAAIILKIIAIATVHA
jgi:hypothetical protein